MIWFYLPLSEDELLLSFVARHINALGGDATQVFPHRGNYNINLVGSLLPSRLTKLASLWRTHPVDPEVLLQRHTLYPYFARFAPSDKAARLRNWALTGQGKRHTMFGVMYENLHRQMPLRFCRSCVEDDLKTGTPRWRRRHQLPGTFVCPTHWKPLIDSNVVPNRQWQRNKPVALSAALAAQSQRRQIDPCEITTLRNVTCLNDAFLTAAPGAINQAVLKQALNRSLGPYRVQARKTTLRTEVIAQQFLQHPSTQIILREMKIELSEEQCAIAWRAISYRDRATHPAFAALALDFLGVTLDDLTKKTKRPASAPPASTPLYPCGNPACVRYDKPPAYHLRQIVREDHIRATCPVCSHSYVWSRKRPRTIEFLSGGPAWENLLRDLVINTTESKREIARRLRVNTYTMQRHALRLGVWRDSWKVPRRSTFKPPRKRSEIVRARQRETWIEYRSTVTHQTTRAMSTQVSGAYNYLLKHDHDWLDANMPLTRDPRAPRVDWKTRDREWTLRAKELIRARRHQNPRAMVSYHWVQQSLGLIKCLSNYRTKLPMLSALIDSAIYHAEDSNDL